jgi:hypothetical protein
MSNGFYKTIVLFNQIISVLLSRKPLPVPRHPLVAARTIAIALLLTPVTLQYTAVSVTLGCDALVLTQSSSVLLILVKSALPKNPLLWAELLLRLG